MEGKKGIKGTHGNLGNAYQRLADFKNALDYHKQDLSIAKEEGNKAREGRAYANLGNAYHGLGDFRIALEYHEQHLSIAKEVGDRAGVGRAYGNLGNAYRCLGDFRKALEYHEQHLSIAKEVGDRAGEGGAYSNLGNAYHCLGDLRKAQEYHERHLSIAKEVGDRAGEGSAYGNLGNAYRFLGDFRKALEYRERDLSIAKEVGDRAGEGRAYANLGKAYHCLGDFRKALKYHEQDLSIAKEVGDRAAEGRAYFNLGNTFVDLGNFRKAHEYHEQHRSIAKELGDKDEEGRAYSLLGSIRCGLGDLEGAIEYYLKGLMIAEKIGSKHEKGLAYCHLGGTYGRLGDLKLAKEYLKQHLIVAREEGDRRGKACASHRLGYISELSGCFHEALNSYQCSVRELNEMRSLLPLEDVLKVSFRDLQQDAYTALWRTLIRLSKIEEALYAAEQGRAQALMDLMALQYGLQLLPFGCRHLKKISTIVRKTSSQIIFVALQGKKICLWVLCKGNVHFKENDVQGEDAAGFLMSLIAASLEENQCGKRSLERLTCAVRCNKESGQTQRSSHRETNSLHLLYRHIFGPIANLLKADEVIIVPDGPLGLAPCAAFVDEASRYLCESFRIRMIPSLTSLKLISNSPEDYHSEAGALLVGDPCLKEIINVFGEPKLPQRPGARKEVEMIGKILHTVPLTGKEATKNEVLKRIGSVALVHIAAHGESGSGEISLAPNPDRKFSVPEKEDYVLKISDVQAVQLRAKLVVLSCSHSGQGEVKAEGVVGIARAFLGAGARSVLASLWAIDDHATMEFMKSFYLHLSNKRSASVSLSQAMKCLRDSEKFSAVKYWAPFVLIGDDVTLDFAEVGAL